MAEHHLHSQTSVHHGHVQLPECENMLGHRETAIEYSGMSAHSNVRNAST